MLASKLLMPTLRDAPAEAEVLSHQLLLRAGMIRKLATGIYSYLPLGQKVLQKLSTIIREELNGVGAQEVLLPILQPAEPWRATGRWEVYGPEMFRLQDRHEHEFCLGPTHEEIVTCLVSNEVCSYRQLPLLLYQIQNKYRDERRPRFGLMRGREFMMQDLYSFHPDEEDMVRTYDLITLAYGRIFARCGLRFRVVEADPGAIGGNISQEFMVMAESGEAEVVYCTQCEYAADRDLAKVNSTGDWKTPPSENPLPMQLVSTPGTRTIEQLVSLLNVPASRVIKAVFYRTGSELVCVLVRGDRQVNELKLRQFLGGREVELIPEKDLAEVVGCGAGYVGPIELTGIPVYADFEVNAMANAISGANIANYHYLNVNPGRDFQIKREADLRMAELGDCCPHCNTVLNFARGIEVGQVFQLGLKYSLPLRATFADENGLEKPIFMGTYGIGVSRTMAAAIEQNHDERGIIWPLNIAPFQCAIVPVNSNDSCHLSMSEKIYRELWYSGIDCILDDRDERAGVKFADCDLIGYPIRLTVGRKTVTEGTVDVTVRSSGETTSVKMDDVVNYVKTLSNALQSANA